MGNHKSKRKVAVQSLVLFALVACLCVQLKSIGGVASSNRNVLVEWQKQSISKTTLPHQKQSVANEKEQKEQKEQAPRPHVHVLATSNGSPYLNWQTRIMYRTFLDVMQKQND